MTLETPPHLALLEGLRPYRAAFLSPDRRRCARTEGAVISPLLANTTACWTVLSSMAAIPSGRRISRCAKYAILSYIVHMWISRAVEPRLQRSAKTRPVLGLTGARQTGNTSTFLRLFPNYAFVSLDLPTEAEQAEKEPSRFLQRHPPPVIIDEVQYAPGLFRHLKVAVDANRTRNGQFLLTGSQKFTLMKNVSESLAGRADIVELETLSFDEIRAALPKTGLETATVRGGFPELYANPNIDSAAFYNSYLATYLERDVRALTNVGSLRDFERFLRACALRSANLLNKADLARDVGIAPSTANLWLSMLEASGQIVLLEPWFSNRTKSIVKSPKLYLSDTGLLCALLNIRSEEALRQSPAAGAVWETFVFAQLRDLERRAGRTGSLFFWRDRTREVDFVVDAGGRLELFEAKWTELPDIGDTVNLAFVRNVVGKSRVAAGAVVSRTLNSFLFPNGFRALPVTELG
jgi:predicted AAA+ superfamily ATPase